MSEEKIRLDKWLWAVRIFKTRTLANEACKGGRVKLKGEPAKSSKEVQIGDIYTIKIDSITKTIQVKAFLDNRVAAKLVEQYMTDLTPQSEYDKLIKKNIPVFGLRERGSGRPTKKERRELEQFSDNVDVW